MIWIKFKKAKMSQKMLNKNFDYHRTLDFLKITALAPWVHKLDHKIELAFNGNRWGDLPGWLDILGRLPIIKPSLINLNTESITVGRKEDCDDKTRNDLEQMLRQLHPWRKGPYDVFGIHVDTEWRSDLKWDRIQDHIQPLEDRLVLDVGCGSGYHCWRMVGQGAKLVIGIDPTMLYVMQFHAVQKYINDPSISVLPLGVDDLSPDIKQFDTVFSMGLLYHRRAPLDHLRQLRSFLKEGGELVLETLVIDGERGDVLCPQDRYAKMPNVSVIPSCPTLESWLKQAGFMNIRLIDVTQTTSQEQRATDWMGFESLADFLDPQNPNRTIEGQPAPKRAIFFAKNF